MRRGSVDLGSESLGIEANVSIEPTQEVGFCFLRVL